jgi:hypothetical protein
MATNRVMNGYGTPFGTQIAKLAFQVINANELAQRIKSAMDAMLGNPVDYTEMEKELGLLAGQGTLLYGIIQSAAANMTAAVAQMGAIDQGLDF